MDDRDCRSSARQLREAQQIAALNAVIICVLVLIDGGEDVTANQN